MRIRHLSLAVLLVLSACGEQQEIACCAIEPKAKCEGALRGVGVSEAEQFILLGPRPVCPAESISAERISELDAQWPAACREAGIAPPRVDSGRC